MQKLFLSILAVSLLSTSCKKDKKDDNPQVQETYHLTAKIDGVQKSFSVEAEAGAATHDQMSLFGVSGMTSQADGSEAFMVMISRHGAAIGKETYSVSSDDTEMSASYYSGTNGSFYAGNDGNIDASKALKFTITEINATSVRGTFSGELYSGGTDDAKRTVTEGKFYLQLTEKVAV
jgi:hypothetical protein